jgi:hypothetical protein
MSITTDASIAQAKTTLLAQSLITNLTHNNVLTQFFRSDTSFLENTGTYGLGSTISIPVVPKITTNIVTATGGGVSYPKQTLTNVSLTLNSIASSPFSINQADLVLANIDPTNDTVSSAARNHGNAIESRLFLNTFNTADIDGNKVGADATPANYKLLRTLWQAFYTANVPDSITKVIILSPKMYGDLLADTTVARLANPDASRTLVDGTFLTTLNMIILPSNALPTLTALSNITGTGTYNVGFAFTTDSIVGAVRELPVTSGLGVNQVVVRNNEVNIATRLTESYNPDVIGGDVRYHMETLFGTKIYRPTTVIPILGGVA